MQLLQGEFELRRDSSSIQASIIEPGNSGPSFLLGSSHSKASARLACVHITSSRNCGLTYNIAAYPLCCLGSEGVINLIIVRKYNIFPRLLAYSSCFVLCSLHKLCMVITCIFSLSLVYIQHFCWLIILRGNDPWISCPVTNEYNLQ